MENCYKESCRILLNKAAKKYSNLLGKDFIIESVDFKNRSKYILRFYEGNFLHLTGVKTKIKPASFFEKALTNQLTNDDFDCDSTRELKGYTREKIPHLMDIDTFFESQLEIQENYSRGKVSCLVAASDGKFTLGFTGGISALNPMTLLNGNMINHSESTKKYSITILVRTTGAKYTSR